MKLISFAVGAMALAVAGIAAGPTAGDYNLMSPIATLDEASWPGMLAGYETTDGVGYGSSIALAGVGGPLPVVAMVWPAGSTGGSVENVEVASGWHSVGGGSTNNETAGTGRPRVGNTTGAAFTGAAAPRAGLQATSSGSNGTVTSSPAGAVPPDGFSLGISAAGLDPAPAVPASITTGDPAPAPGGLTLASLAVANPDLADPALAGPVLASPAPESPAVETPAPASPGPAGPAIASPALASPTLADLAIAAPAVTDPAVSTPPLTYPPLTYPATIDPAPAEGWVMGTDPSNVGPTGSGTLPNTLASSQDPTTGAHPVDEKSLQALLNDGLADVSGSGTAAVSSTPGAVPEPATIASFGIAAVAMMARRRKGVAAV